MRLRSVRDLGPLGVALALGQVAWTLRQHWVTLPLGQRERLQQLLRESRGNPLRLSTAKRHELWSLVRALELAGAVRRGATKALLSRR